MPCGRHARPASPGRAISFLNRRRCAHPRLEPMHRPAPDLTEVAYRRRGLDAAREYARKRRGRNFDPALADLFITEAEELVGGIDAGRWPMAILFRLMPLMARSAKTSERHKKDFIVDFKQNRAGDAVRVCGEYLDYIAADRNFAAELAASGSPVWVVHAEEKGDGGLTDAERTTLEAAPNVTLVTIPGAVFLIPDEAPQHTAAVIADALKQAT